MFIYRVTQGNNICLFSNLAFENVRIECTGPRDPLHYGENANDLLFILCVTQHHWSKHLVCARVYRSKFYTNSTIGLRLYYSHYASVFIEREWLREV